MITNTIFKILGNLTYVDFDRASAAEYWGKVTQHINDLRAGRETMATGFYEDNYAMLYRQKLVAGIVGHRHNYGFRRHWLREKIIQRRIAREAAQ